jgi:four helix bundle protein
VSSEFEFEFELEYNEKFCSFQVIKITSPSKDFIMFLKLAHTRMEVYVKSYALILEAYKITKTLPESERFNLISQLRRAAISVRLNIAEGCSRKSLSERKRYYEIARGSVVEIDSALDIVVGLEYSNKEKLMKLGDCIVEMFRLLSGLIDPKHNTTQ